MTESDKRSQAVMNVDKGEEIAGLWATPQIPRIGVYKLAAKKRLDGKFEWVHFQHRLDGARKVMARGDVETKGRLADVLDATNKALSRIYGVTMQVAEFETSTLDGKKFDGPMH